ncbi:MULTISPECIES: hypothetical protein [Bacillus amyloliquefaciens group]|uniref:hypothetical protein n=1 Tax=Bacillus amyloliquefaciens group TaxID=1938374 RepID=UPI00226DED9D|nr:hypothetical protein [Bacillus velezensis]MCY0092193.1 hypothetical protein [Bacillus velezensis]
MKRWTATDGNYTYTIEEKDDGKFDLMVDHLGDKVFWLFQSYNSARNFLRNEYAFTGRMKQVKEDVRNACS